MRDSLEDSCWRLCSSSRLLFSEDVLFCNRLPCLFSAHGFDLLHQRL